MTRATGALFGALLLGAATIAAKPAPRSATAAPPPGWHVDTREHVDLWLHGFAMLTSDTGHVPFFARGYKQRIHEAKRQRNILTSLDANQEQLQARFTANPALTNAQFLAMYFPSFQEIVNATDAFVRSGGNPRAGSDPQMRQEIGMLASLFPAPADRNWLRLFVQSLQDENTKFYQAYWNIEQGARGAAFAAFQSKWQSSYYPKIQRFLNNSEEPTGDLLLSLPLGGEGRTVNENKSSNTIAVTFPTSPDSVADAFFVFVHEAIGRVADQAIADNTTPAENRSGVAAGYQGVGAVRAGAVLVQHTAPDMLADYMRYYLRAGNMTPPSGDPAAAFNAAFPLPQPILDAITRQIDAILGGI